MDNKAPKPEVSQPEIEALKTRQLVNAHRFLMNKVRNTQDYKLLAYTPSMGEVDYGAKIGCLISNMALLIMRSQAGVDTNKQPVTVNIGGQQKKYATYSQMQDGLDDIRGEISRLFEQGGPYAPDILDKVIGHDVSGFDALGRVENYIGSAVPPVMEHYLGGDPQQGK